MLALVIDTSSAAVTAGVVECSGEIRLLAERVIVDARAHGELLAPSVRAALAEAGVEPAGLRAVIAGVGPGPFTGLRVGLVTAAAFGDALGLPTYGVCSLDAIAAAAGAADLLVAADARRKEIYWARYVDGVRVGEPDVAKPADVHTDATTMAGAGARLYAGLLGLPLLEADYPTVLGLAARAADRVRAGAPSEPLTPLYLRRPDAVAAAGTKKVSQPRTADR